MVQGSRYAASRPSTTAKAIVSITGSLPSALWPNNDEAEVLHRPRLFARRRRPCLALHMRGCLAARTVSMSAARRGGGRALKRPEPNAGLSLPHGTPPVEGVHPATSARWRGKHNPKLQAEL